MGQSSKFLRQRFKRFEADGLYIGMIYGYAVRCRDVHTQSTPPFNHSHGCPKSNKSLKLL